MFYSISHRIQYAYSRAVFIEPCVLRLRPRSDCTQNLLRWEARIDPTPAGRTEYVDLEGSSTTCAWFDGLHDSLSVSVESDVETLRENPFDFILADPAHATLPVARNAHVSRALDPYRARTQASEAVGAFARALLDEASGETLRFLSLLARRMHEDFERVLRLEGDAWAAERTLKDKGGACRDLAVLFNDACRSLGLPARFVSGYHEGDPDNPENDLHAWSEVYLPGGGWRGFDPTHGLAVADRHIALTAAIEPGDAAPVTGAFRGTGAVSDMEHRVDVRPRP